MAEYVMQPGDDPAEVARMLIERAEAPEHVMWAPRPDTPGGGVFVVPDEEVVGAVARQRAEAREAEAARIAEAQRSAEERDQRADETGLTPAELGIPASQGVDPGSAGEAERNAEIAAASSTEGDDESAEGEPDDGEPAQDDPATPEDESKSSTAQRRAARRNKAAEATTSEEGK